MLRPAHLQKNVKQSKGLHISIRNVMKEGKTQKQHWQKLRLPYPTHCTVDYPKHTQPESI